MIDLKPCPFCGGPAEFEGNEGIDHYVICTKCSASSGVSRKSFKQAARDWNRRASPWQVIETAPRDGTLILAVKSGRQNHAVVSWKSWANVNPEHPWSDMHAGVYYKETAFTHWMPLPEQPEVEG